MNRLLKSFMILLGVLLSLCLVVGGLVVCSEIMGKPIFILLAGIVAIGLLWYAIWEALDEDQ